MLAFFRRWSAPALFAVGIAFLAFITGTVVGADRSFPYTVLWQAREAASDLRQNWRHYLGIRSKFAAPSDRIEGGVTIHDEKRASAGLTFVVGLFDGRFEPVLIDMQGNIAHRWDGRLSRAFADSDYAAGLPPDWDNSIHGALMYPNGDVQLTVGYSGTMKLDRCSNVLWAVPRRTHHSIDPMPDGGVVMPSAINITAPSPERPFINPGIEGYYRDDTVLFVDSNGKITDEFSVLDTIFDSNWPALLTAAPQAGNRIAENDILHLNDVEPLTAELAPAFPMFEAGDLLLSMRYINTIMVLDGDDRHIKWKMTGPFIGQHDPDFMPNGHILLFDNRVSGDTPKYGPSAILEIDPATREIVWSYDGSDAQPFYAHSRGLQDLLPNGNVLVSDAVNGRIFEVTRDEEPEIVWEWINLVEPGYVGEINDIQRFAVDSFDWLGKPCL